MQSFACYPHPPWHLRRTGFPAAWRLLRRGRSRRGPVRVALLDSGVDLHHPCLQGILGSGVNLLRPGSLPEDEHGHGTHVAGIVAAGIGAWHPKWNEVLSPADIILYPVKIFDQAGIGRIENIVNGLAWCIEQKIDIVNLSFGTEQKTNRSLHRAVQEVDKAGILMVAAAGNDGRRSVGTVDYPGRYPVVITVTACNRRDRLASFASAGSEVDLVAPGDKVISLAPGGGFARMSGTSMAAPHVTAAAALLLYTEPYLAPQGIRSRLKSTAEWLPQIPSRSQGEGLLRVDRLLRRI